MAEPTTRVSVRLTKKMREAIDALSQAEDLDQVEAMRFVMEAGLQLAKEKGLAQVMAKRTDFLAGQFPPPPKPGPNTKPKKGHAKKK